MTNSTGNNNGNNGNHNALPVPAVPADAVLAPPGVTGLPELVYPNINWSSDDYARLCGRLDLYSDFIVLTRFQGGQAQDSFVVDPVEVTTALSSLSLTSGLLPENCLFWGKQGGDDGLAVYLPPQVWLVTVRPSASSPSTSSGQAPSTSSGQAWRVPLPGLVFYGRGYNYALFAVLERPAADTTQLYMAPVPNVHEKGVCLGSAPFPKAGPATMRPAVEAFFSSKFNRDLSNRKSRAYPDCVLDQWRALHEAGAESYPVDDLIGTNLALRSLYDAA